MVNQHYRSSERGKAGMFPLQQVLLDFFFLQHDLMAQFGSEPNPNPKDWSASYKESHNKKLSDDKEDNSKLGHNHRYAKCLSK